MAGSEIARLRDQIAQEYQAAHQGLYGLAVVGTVSHRHRTECTEQIGRALGELIKLVGPDEAIRIVAETLDAQDRASDETAGKTPGP